MKRERQAFNSNFILFLIGRMVSDTGTSIQMMIMPIYIIDAGGSAATIGLFSFISLVPALLVYPFAGVLGDRMNRKKIMVTTDLISAGVILGLGIISHLDRMSMTLLLASMAVISLLNGLFDPATRAMLPQLVAKDKLTRANSKVSSLRGLSVLLGPVIGAVMYSKMGITILLFTNGFSFLLSAISEMFISYKYVERKSVDGILGIVTDMNAGVKFILEDKIVSKLCYFFIAIYSLIQPIFAVTLPLFFKTSLGYSDTQYGYLQSISIGGMLLGSILVGVLFGKDSNMLKPLKIGSNLLLFSVFMFSFVMFPSVVSLLGNDSVSYFILLIIILCLFSAANMFINVPMQSFIQKKTPNQYLSRVFSIVGMITRGGMPLGALIYGIILNRFEAHWTVLVAAILMMLISSAFLISITKASEIQ